MAKEQITKAKETVKKLRAAKKFVLLESSFNYKNNDHLSKYGLSNNIKDTMGDSVCTTIKSHPDYLKKWYFLIKKEDTYQLFGIDYTPPFTPYKKDTLKEDIIKYYIGFVKKFGSPKSLVDLVTDGMSKASINKYFASLNDLNAMARALYHNDFEDIKLATLLSEAYKQDFHVAVNKHSKIVVTAIVIGIKVDNAFLNSLKYYCQKTNALLVIMLCEQSKGKFSEYYIPKELLRTPEFSSIFILPEDTIVGNYELLNLRIADKTAEPLRGLGRMAQAQQHGYIIASPKQELEVVPVIEGDPYFLLTTGVISKAEYLDIFLNEKTSTLADSDHVMGACILEKDDESENIFSRFIQSNDDSFVDINTRYYPDGRTESYLPKALIEADRHIGETDPEADAAWIRLYKLTTPEFVVMHDIFSGRSISPFDRENLIDRAKHWMLLENEIKEVVKELNRLLEVYDRIVIVKSNHDERLDKYIQRGEFFTDSGNLAFCLDLAQQMIKGVDPLPYAVNACGLKYPERVRWLKRDEDFKIKDIQCGVHGDIGLGGSRGNMLSTELGYGSAVVAHSHSAGKKRNIWRVGTSTYKRLGYNRGASSWTHTCALVFDDGSVQLITVINKKFMREDKI